MMPAAKQVPNPAAARRIMLFLAFVDFAVACATAFVLPAMVGTEHVELGMGISAYHVAALLFLGGSIYFLVMASRYGKAAASKAGPIQR